MKDLTTVAYLTGTANVLKNGFLHDTIEQDVNPAYSIGQMFFKPYKSNKEFIFAANNTFSPMLFLGCAVINPLGVSLVFPTLLLGSVMLSIVGSFTGNQYCLEMASKLLREVLQTITNLFLLPLSASVMLTRGISTGLKAAGICDYDGSQTEILQVQLV